MKIKHLFEALPNAKDFDAKNLDSNDLIDILRMTGYQDTETEDTIRDADESGHLVYAGYTKAKSHKYIYAWYDGDDAEAWVVVALYVDLGPDGKIQCDFGSMPIHEFDEEDEMDKYFKRVKNNPEKN